MSRLFTDEQAEYIRNNVNGIGNKELAEQVNEKYGLNITREQIKNYKANNNLSSGLTGYYSKGCIPHNKGKKMSPEQYKKCEGTMYKKGNIPKCHRLVGSERINKDGYIEIKVEEPNKWKLKHRAVWEAAHGKVKKGMKIIFLDRNKLNVNLDNLAEVTSEELLILNKQKVEGMGKEAMKCRITMAKIEKKTRERKKK